MPMFAILAEDDSDAEVLQHLVRRRLQDEGISVKRKGYDGCASLCRKGARDIKSWVSAGVTRVIICHDADRNPPAQVRQKVLNAVVNPSGFYGPSCVVIPVQEIEAWIIADEVAINEIIPSFKFIGHPRPETLNDPKEWLCRQSRASNGKPLCAPKTFNPAVARRLRFEVVAAKCESFMSFVRWLDDACSEG